MSLQIPLKRNELFAPWPAVFSGFGRGSALINCGARAIIYIAHMDLKKVIITLGLFLLITQILWVFRSPDTIASDFDPNKVMVQTRISKDGRFFIKNFKDSRYVLNGFHNLYCKQGRLSGDERLACANDGKVVGVDGLFCRDDKGQYSGRPEGVSALTCEPKGSSFLQMNKYLPLKKQSLKHFPIDISSIFKRFFSKPFSENFKGVDYLIITRPIFKDDLAGLIGLKEGLTVAVVTVEDILSPPSPFYADYSGDDIQETLKEFLKRLKGSDVHVTHKVDAYPRYVLIVGSARAPTDNSNEGWANVQYSKGLDTPWEVPIRYVFSEEDWTDGSLYPGIPTDQYYASASADWDKNGNRIYGEFENHEYSFQPDFYVGRIPVKTPEDLRAFVDKLKKWVPTDRFRESTFSGGTCKAHDFYKNYVHDKKCHSCDKEDCGDEAAYANDDGSNYLSSYSHGNYKRTSGVFQLTQESSLKNSPIVFLHACQVGGMDYAGESLCQHLISVSDGAVACIASSRSMPDINFRLKDAFFFSGTPILGQAFYQYKFQEDKERQLSSRNLQVFLMYQLYGDPAMRVIPDAKIRVTTNDIIDLSWMGNAIDAEVINQVMPIKGTIIGCFPGDCNIQASDAVVLPLGTTKIHLTKLFEYELPRSDPIDGTVRQLMAVETQPAGFYTSMSTTFVTTVGPIIKTGTRPLIFKKYPISCDPEPLVDMEGNIVFNFKVRSEKPYLKVEILGSKGGYEYPENMENLEEIKLATIYTKDIDANEQVFTWKAKELWPTHRMNNYRDLVPYRFEQYELQFYNGSESIGKCPVWPGNSFLDYFRTTKVSPEDCANGSVDFVSSPTTLVFPSGRYVFIRNIDLQKGTVQFRTFGMDQEGSLSIGGSIKLPPVEEGYAETWSVRNVYNVCLYENTSGDDTVSAEPAVDPESVAKCHANRLETVVEFTISCQP